MSKAIILKIESQMSEIETNIKNPSWRAWGPLSELKGYMTCASDSGLLDGATYKDYWDRFNDLYVALEER